MANMYDTIPNEGGSSSGIDAKTMTEIQRKAQNNIPLVQSTPEKQQAYDSYLKANQPAPTQPKPSTPTNPITSPVVNNPVPNTSSPSVPSAPTPNNSFDMSGLNGLFDSYNNNFNTMFQQMNQQNNTMFQQMNQQSAQRDQAMLNFLNGFQEQQKNAELQQKNAQLEFDRNAQYKKQMAMNQWKAGNGINLFPTMDNVYQTPALPQNNGLSLGQTNPMFNQYASLLNMWGGK